MPYSLTEASQPIDSVIYWHNRCVDAKPDIHKCNHRRIRIGCITRRIYSILNTHSYVTRCLILVRKWNSTLLGNMTPPRNGHIRMIESTFANLTFYDKSYYANSLWPGDVILRHKTGSTLARVMVCCLAAPSHYLNQCWLIIRKVQWHST